MIYDTAKSFGSGAPGGASGGAPSDPDQPSGSGGRVGLRPAAYYTQGCEPREPPICDADAQVQLVLAYNATVVSAFPASGLAAFLPFWGLPQIGLPAVDASALGPPFPWGTATPLIRPVSWRSLGSAWNTSVTPAVVPVATTPFAPDPAAFVARVNQLMGYTLPTDENIQPRDMDLAVWGISISFKPTGQTSSGVAQPWDGVTQSTNPDTSVKGPISITINASSFGRPVTQHALVLPFSESLSDMAQVTILSASPVQINDTVIPPGLARWAQAPWHLATGLSRYGAPRQGLDVVCKYYGNRLDVGAAPGSVQVADAVYAPRMALLYDRDHLRDLARVVGRALT